MSELSDRTEKPCPRCQRLLSVESFAKNRTSPEGRQGYCRDCFADLYAAKGAAQGKVVRRKVVVPDGHKHCRGCDQTKPLSDWNRNRASSDGWSSYCRSCCAERNRISYFSRTYGLSVQEVRDLLELQPVCAICMTRPPVHIDHDHETGKVRGMLCFPCNAALGQLQDDPTIIRRAAEYVEGNVWQPIKVAAGAYQLPISLPEARRSPSSSVRMPRTSFRADARLLQLH